jgi:hypothetical protein
MELTGGALLWTENRRTGALFGPPGPDRDYPATQRFLAQVRPPMRATPMLLRSGGHNFQTWALEQGPALEWLSAELVSG